MTIEKKRLLIVGGVAGGASCAARARRLSETAEMVRIQSSRNLNLKCMSEAIAISKIEPSDWLLVWKIIEPVFRSGETYAFSPEISETDAYKVWVEAPTATYVVKNDSDKILGTYYIKPNQPALGSHVCNCGYIVGEQSRGKGVASLMCEHSQREAIRLGFRAMQFNLVVSTNEGAIGLWKKLGFTIVGTLPGAFKHSKHGFVDAFVMYKQLKT